MKAAFTTLLTLASVAITSTQALDWNQVINSFNVPTLPQL